jgi:SpoIID/LytB domain protein
MLAHRSPARTTTRRAGAALTAALTAVALLAWTAHATAQESPTYTASALPSTLAVNGHGWGPGRGMGQYGSLGYATGISGTSWSHSQILDHFYGGTTAGHIGNPLMMVWLKSRPAGSAMVVYRAAGLQVVGQTDTPPAVRVTPRSDGDFDLQTGTACGGPWSTPARVVEGPVRVVKMPDSGDTALRLCNGDGTAIAYHSSGELVALGDKTYNLVRMEEMLRGIVPRESPASWGDAGGGAGMAALRAQAVAARSYAAAGDTRWGSPHLAVGADATTCDDQFCQVYGGVARITAAGAVETRTHPNTDRAVADTANEVRMLNGGVARTEFASSTGGWTAGGTFPPVVDEGDAVSSNPNHAWTTNVARTKLESTYGLGTLTQVRVTKRNGLGDMGGRVSLVELAGTAKTVTISGNTLRQGLGLKSDWFDVTIPPIQPRAIGTACPSASVPAGAFSDVPADSPHRFPVDCVAWRDIAEGTGAGLFSPGVTVTREQMASFVARMMEADGALLPASPPDAFDDDAGSVHERRVNQLAALDIVRGTSGRTYGAKLPIDRAQVASILQRAILKRGVTLPAAPPDQFSDDAGLVHETAINQLAGVGVVTGTAVGVYTPAASTRRDQMASMVARALDLVLER